MDSVPTIPQRPQRRKDRVERVSEISETRSLGDKALEDKANAHESQPTLSTPPIPSRPKKLSATSGQGQRYEPEVGEKDFEICATPTLNSSTQGTIISPLVTPTDIISGYELDNDDNELVSLSVESDVKKLLNLEAGKNNEVNETPPLNAERVLVDQGVDSDGSSAPDMVPKSSRDFRDLKVEESSVCRATSEDNTSTTSPIDVKNSTDSELFLEHIANDGEDVDESGDKVLRPRSPHTAHSETALPIEDVSSSSLQQNDTDYIKSDKEEAGLESESSDRDISNKQNASPLAQNAPPDHHIASDERDSQYNNLKAFPEAREFSGSEGGSVQKIQCPEVPARPHPTIPTRPKKRKEVAAETHPREEDLSKDSLQLHDASSQNVVLNAELDESNSLSGTKKAPPPKPKKLSSKIAAFQQMFNQEPPQKPILPKRPSEERTKLSSDRSDFAASLLSMMGRGVALPGMAQPELMKKISAAETPDEGSQSTETDSTNSVGAATVRRTRGPRGKRLPKLIQESKVEVKSRFTIHLADLWEVDIRKTYMVEERGALTSHEGRGLTDDVSDSTEAQLTNSEAFQQPDDTMNKTGALDKSGASSVKHNSHPDDENVPFVSDDKSEVTEGDSHRTVENPDDLKAQEEYRTTGLGEEIAMEFVISSAVSDLPELSETRVVEELIPGVFSDTIEEN